MSKGHLFVISVLAWSVAFGQTVPAPRPFPLAAEAGLIQKELQPYVPARKVSGTIRNFGNNYIPSLMKAWEEGFQRVQPGIRFETTLVGSEAAMAGLYGGVADLAFIGREIYPSESQAFEESMGYPPLGIEISSGSFATPHKTFALMVFVHRDNPIARMSMADLARIYGCEGADCGYASGSVIKEWGQLGLTGKWEHRPIHVYGYDLTTGMARYFQGAVLGGNSNHWTEALRDFDNGHPTGGPVVNAGVYILEALAKDPEGIAYANLLYANPEVKTLALSRDTDPSGTYWAPTRENVLSRDYPLTRFTTVVLNRKPGTAVDPKLKEFLSYVLSRDGMDKVVSDGAYVPLNATQTNIERGKLD